MSNHADYSDRFDGIVAGLMFFLIISAIAGVVTLQRMAHTDCTVAAHTFCGTGSPVEH